MTKKDSSRFDQLFNAARKAPESSEGKPLAKSTRKSKSSDPDYIRTTVYLPKSLHKKLKSAAIEKEQDMSTIVEKLVREWLASK
jgi:hypothetical protein